MPVPTYELNDGSTLPVIGFGTYPMRGEGGIAAITSALETGYRLVDTAVNFENEEEVGEALRRSGVPRDEVAISTKVPGRHHSYPATIACVEESLRRMHLDYLDIALIHWPNPGIGLYRESWRGLVEARDRDLVRVIGVCNFTKRFLADIIEETGVTPALNQIELHPLFPQEQMRAVNEHLDIRTMSWSPLGKHGAPFDDPVVTSAAEAHGVGPAQVILRWHVQLGTLPLPKAAEAGHQRENLDIFGFELTDDEMEAITQLGRPDGRLYDADPNTHEEM